MACGALRRRGLCHGFDLNHFPGAPLLLVLLVAALSGFVAAALIGFFCVRLSGAYFALTTLAFQMFFYAVALKWRSLTHGDDGMGITRPDLDFGLLGSISLRSTDNMYYFTLIIVAIGILACYFFLKTPLGNSFVCVRENELRASFLGYNVFLIKLIAFSAAGVLVGLAGGLFVLFQEFVATACMDLNMGMTPVLMTIIGGSGHFLGPVLGAAFYVIFQDWISSLTNYWMIIMGGIFIFTVLYLKGGLISLSQIEKIRGSRVTEGKMRTILRLDNLAKDFSGLEVLTEITMNLLRVSAMRLSAPMDRARQPFSTSSPGFTGRAEEGYSFLIRISPAGRPIGLPDWDFPDLSRSSLSSPK